MPGVLTDKEEAAVRALKWSKRCVCLAGNQCRLLSAIAGSITWSDTTWDNTAA